MLWCYKKDLEFSSHKKKRLKQIKKMETKGNLDKEEVNQIELFLASKDIRYCYYKDSHKILGQTFGMCILQDFESITPNVLCRTMETVEGGGLVVMLFNTMTSLKQLYTISMDVHSRYRTEAHAFVEPRFNERFILSLGSCETCIAIDDELNILPITSHIKEIKEVQLPGLQGAGADDIKSENLYLTKEQRELKDLKLQLKETKPIGNLVSICKTLDQARSVMQIVDTISEKSMKTTISLTAGRGRGKSASLGISLASAIVYGFSNIFVTAPTPENLGSVFEFLFRGLDALNYREHQDYEILQSTNPEFNNAVVRVNIYRDHRQTIQYIRP
jgi:N-acetyltransferase 10